jgi:hypothetical protein
MCSKILSQVHILRLCLEPNSSVSLLLVGRLKESVGPPACRMKMMTSDAWLNQWRRSSDTSAPVGRKKYNKEPIPIHVY